MKNWRVIKNGQLPEVAKFQSLEAAFSYVVEQTGEREDRVHKAFHAGCPTVRDRDGAEFDIEEAA